MKASFALHVQCEDCLGSVARQAPFALRVQCVYGSAMGRRPAKSETLTIRLDAKMRFAVEFVARVKGQSITTVVERAIKTAADELRISSGGGDNRSWLAYWSVSEGVRAIRLGLDVDTNPTFEEDEIIDFVKNHWPFFSDDAYLRDLRQSSIDVIWPEIKGFVEYWRQTKSTDRLSAGKSMQDALRKANAWVPAWPQSSTESDPAKPASAFRGRPRGEAEDEIPF